MLPLVQVMENNKTSYHNYVNDTQNNHQVTMIRSKHWKSAFNRSMIGCANIYKSFLNAFLSCLKYFELPVVESCSTNKLALPHVCEVLSMYRMYQFNFKRQVMTSWRPTLLYIVQVVYKKKGIHSRDPTNNSSIYYWLNCQIFLNESFSLENVRKLWKIQKIT